jgi:hypothetical protein
MFPSQLPLAHCGPALHADPFVAGAPQIPPLHVCPAMQSALPAHEVLHVVPPHL